MTIEAGRQARDEGIEQARYQQHAWLGLARERAVEIARREGCVTVNDLRGTLPPLPEGCHHNVWGAVFKCRALKPVGFTQAAHKEAHARLVRIYQLRSAPE